MRAANPIHPGQILLEEFLVPAGVSQRAFAKRVGWTAADHFLSAVAATK